jgi:predicted transcriptional regulator
VFEETVTGPIVISQIILNQEFDEDRLMELATKTRRESNRITGRTYLSWESKIDDTKKEFMRVSTSGYRFPHGNCEASVFKSDQGDRNR